MCESQISPLRKQFNLDAKKYYLSSAQLNKRFAEIAKFKRDIYHFLNQYDLIICPPSGSTAKRQGQCLNEIRDFTYTMSFNTAVHQLRLSLFDLTKRPPHWHSNCSNLWKDHVVLAAAKVLGNHYHVKTRSVCQNK